VFWLVGLAGRARNLAHQLQANTIRDRFVLSTPFVGRELLRRRLAVFPSSVFDDALEQLHALLFQPSLA
ncbi:MAG TPA: hypothetical protein VGK73_02275, partial [Polyangiaceae bacterium]